MLRLLAVVEVVIGGGYLCHVVHADLPFGVTADLILATGYLSLASLHTVHVLLVDSHDADG